MHMSLLASHCLRGRPRLRLSPEVQQGLGWWLSGASALAGGGGDGIAAARAAPLALGLWRPATSLARPDSRPFGRQQTITRCPSSCCRNHDQGNVPMQDGLVTRILHPGVELVLGVVFVQQRGVEPQELVTKVPQGDVALRQVSDDLDQAEGLSAHWLVLSAAQGTVTFLM